MHVSFLYDCIEVGTISWQEKNCPSSELEEQGVGSVSSLVSPCLRLKGGSTQQLPINSHVCNVFNLRKLFYHV